MIEIHFSAFATYCRDQLGLSANSIRAYQQDLRAFKRFADRYGLSGMPKPDDMVEYHQYLREERSSGAATIRRRFATLRSYFRWLQEEADGSLSPFDGLRLELKVPRRLPRPIDRPTLSALFQASKHLVEEGRGLEAPTTSDQITGLIARLLVVTGMRIGEATNLRISDVSHSCSRIRVRGKGNRERTVYITNARLLRDLRHHREFRNRSSDAHAFLFLNSRGSRLTEAAFRKRLRTLSGSLSIEPHLTPHRFRHSAATMLIEEGVDIRLVQRLLGHASISTTEIYTKVSDNSLVSAIERADTLAQVDG